MYKERCKTTKLIDFKIQKYSLNMTIQYHSGTLILFLSHGKYKCVLSHPMGSNDIPIDKPENCTVSTNEKFLCLLSVADPDKAFGGQSNRAPQKVSIV